MQQHCDNHTPQLHHLQRLLAGDIETNCETSSLYLNHSSYVVIRHAFIKLQPPAV